MKPISHIELDLTNSEGEKMLIVLATPKAAINFFQWSKQFDSIEDKQKATDQLMSAMKAYQKRWNAHNN